MRRAGAPVANVAKSFHDDYMKKNAKFRSDAGIKCYINRTTDGNCCKWCSSIAGRYVYGEEPQDVFRRHDNCGCMTTYENGRQRQDVWSKKSWEVPSLTRRDSAPARLSTEQARELQVRNLSYRGLTNDGESGIINTDRKMSALNQNAPDFSLYQITDTIESRQAVSDMAEMIKTELDIANVDLSGIKNTEALAPFIRQLKKIKEETGMKFPSIKAVNIIDGDDTCIAGYKPMEQCFYISSRYFNCRQAIEDTMKDWANKGILPKQAKSLRYLAEHESAHIRIPDELLKTEEALKIWKHRKLTNKNDCAVFEYYADVVAIYRMNRNTTERNIIEAIEYLKNGGVAV